MAYNSYIKKLTKDSREVVALEELLEMLDISRFRRNLRTILFLYLMDQHHNLIPDFEHLIEDMRFFFDFLDVLDEETVFEEQKYET